MADFLELGIDASQSKKGADDFAQAGKKIEQSAEQMDARVKKTGDQVKSFANTVEKDLGKGLSSGEKSLHSASGAMQLLQGSAAKLGQDFRGSLGPMQEWVTILGSVSPLAGLAVVGIAAVSIALLEATKSAVAFASTLQDASQETGFTAEKLALLKGVAELNGTAFNQVITAIDQFENKLIDAASGNAKLAAEFQNLGINVKKALNDPQAAFDQFIEQLNRIPNAAERVAVAKDLMGRGGVKMTRIIEELVEKGKEEEKWLRDVGYILTGEQVAALDQAGDAWTKMGQASEGAVNRIANELAPVLTRAMMDIVDTGDDLRDIWPKIGASAAEFFAEIIVYVRKTKQEFNDLADGIWNIGKAFGSADTSLGIKERTGLIKKGIGQLGSSLGNNSYDADFRQILNIELEQLRQSARDDASRGGGAGRGIRPPRGGSGGGGRSHREELTDEQKLMKEINDLEHRRLTFTDAGIVKLMERKSAIGEEVKLAEKVLKLRQEVLKDDALKIPGLLSGALPAGKDGLADYAGKLEAIERIKPSKLADDIQKLALAMAKTKAPDSGGLSIVGAALEADNAIAEETAASYAKLTTALEKFIIKEDQLGTIAKIKKAAGRLAPNSEGQAIVGALIEKATISQSLAGVRDYRGALDDLVNKYRDLTEWQKISLEITRDARLTEEDRARLIGDLADAQKTAKLQAELSKMRGAIRSFAEDSRSILEGTLYEGITGGWRKGLQFLTTSFSQTLAKLASELLTSVFYKSLSGLGGSSGGGGFAGILSKFIGPIVGGLFGGIGGDITGGGGYGGFGGAGFAAGGPSQGGWTTVGELGPERVYLPRGANVENNYQVRQGQASAPVTVTVNVIGATNPQAFAQSSDQIAARLAQSIARQQRNQ